MKNKRILVVVPHYYPAIGGVETYSQALVKEFSKDNAVTVVTTRLARTKAHEKRDGANIIRLKPWFRLSNTPINLFWYFSMKRIISKLKPDAIHVHSPVPFLPDMAVLAAGKRYPVHLTYHSGSMLKGSGMSDRIINFYEEYLLPRIFNRATSIGAVLPAFVEKELPDTSKVHFTPPGINTDIYLPGKNTKRKTDIIFAGRIEHTSNWKGVDVLLTALSLLKKGSPHFSAQIIGNGDAVAHYRKIAAELNIADNVEFITGLRGNEVIPFYQQAKLIVLPSKTQAESFGMVLAEAMACGVVAIGSRIGGIPNVIEHGKSGMLVPPNDPGAIADTIQHLLNNQQMMGRLSQQGMVRIRENFTLRRMLALNSRLIQSLTKKPVVHISAHYPPHLGGMEAAISMLTHKLHDNDRRVSVIASDKGVSTHASLSDIFSVTRLKSKTIASTPIMPSLLFTLLKTSPRSVFHVHIAQAGIPEVAFLAARIKRIPIVMHLHGDVEASSAAGFLLPMYKKYFLGFVLRGASMVIVPTNTYKKTMQKRYRLTNDIRVIPTGIEEKNFLTAYKKANKKYTTVLYVGRLSVEKNISLLIEAVQMVTQPIRFIIVGDGPLKADIKKQITKNRTHQMIELAGRKTPSELLSYYKDADIFMLASNYESQSLATLEAMAARTPVIVANVAAVNEIVGDAGMLVDKTSRGFSVAITKLIEDPALAHTFSIKGRDRAEEFSWKRLTELFEEAYDSVQ